MANDTSLLQIAQSPGKAPDSMPRQDIMCSIFHNSSVGRKLMKKHRIVSKARPYIELQRHSLALDGWWDFITYECPKRR